MILTFKMLQKYRIYLTSVYNSRHTKKYTISTIIFLWQKGLQFEDILYTSLEIVMLLQEELLCATERVLKKKEENNEKDVKRCRENRCGCKTSMEIVLNKNGSWEIKKFSNSHSHDLLNIPNKKKEIVVP